jgi:hypothetical protein
LKVSYLLLTKKTNAHFLVRPYNKDEVTSNIKVGTANEEEVTLELNVPWRLYGLIIGKFDF